MRIPKSMAEMMPVTGTPGVLTGSGRLRGAGRLLTAQHSHELLQQVQELLDVHQVLGLQALPGRGGKPEHVSGRDPNSPPGPS